MNIRRQLVILFMATLVMLIGVGVYMTSLYRDAIMAEEDILTETSEVLEQSYQVERFFHRQLNDWKNILLRGADVAEYHHYLSAFYRSEKDCRNSIDALKVALEGDPVLAASADDLRNAHTDMGRILRRAIQLYNKTDNDPGLVTDQFAIGLESKPLILLEQLILMLNQKRTSQILAWREYRNDQEVFAFTLLTVLTVMSLLTLVWLVDKNIGKPAAKAAYLAEVIENVQTIARFGTWDWDSREGKHYWSKGVYEILDIDPETEPSTSRFIAALGVDERERVNDILETARRDVAPFEFEARIQLDEGEHKVILQRGEVRRTKGGQVRMTSLIYDISELKAAEERLSFLANYDSLTGLPNRALFLDRLDHAISLAKRNKHKVGLIFLDLDQFKAINDAMGHPAGDALLVQVAGQLKGALREVDTAARLGGDEFTVVLEHLESQQDLERVAEYLLSKISTTYRIAGKDIFVSTSMGVTLFPDDADDAEGLLKNADSAMYLAKEKGRNAFEVFTKELDHKAQRRLVLENDLRKALDKGELQLYYQPTIDLNTGRVVCAEALLRWFSSGEIMKPAEFVPTLEESGLIQKVGDWVLGKACVNACQWRDSGLSDLKVAVNISVRQLRQSDMAARIGTILDKAGLAPGLLQLEITERTLIDCDTIGANLKKLESMGVVLAIDDFGTGQSSLSNLRHFDIDSLKIDRSFIHDIHSDADDDAVTTAIIGLSQTLGMKVIAEGVETLDQYRFLESQGCQMIQGYLISEPMPLQSFTEWLEEHSDPQAKSAFWHLSDVRASDSPA